MYCQDVEALLRTSFPDAQIQVDSADLQHFSAIVLSDTFVGQTLLLRQRQIYAVLGHLLQDGTIHALQIHAYTPIEWQQRCATHPLE